MTKEERLQELHRRMEVRRHKKENARTVLMGAGSLILALCLVVLIGSTGFSHQGTTAGLYSGAALLFEGSGGYVLTALIAFMLGVTITALLKKKQGKQQKEEENR